LNIKKIALLFAIIFYQFTYSQESKIFMNYSGMNLIYSPNIFNDLIDLKINIFLFIIIIVVLLFLIYSLYKTNFLREQSNKELKLANEELKLAKEKAEIASQLKTQFVSTVSHELRTPLYGVIGITNIILEEHKELANSPHLNSLKFSARYLLSLVNDLLQINKIEENKIILENMIFNVTDEILTIIDSLEYLALKNNNKLFTKIDLNIPDFLIGDKLRLSQVFMNLISNALKFTKDGSVTVSAKLDRVEASKHYIYFEIKEVRFLHICQHYLSLSQFQYIYQ
jgi:signal transduction histidine kinase